MFLNNIWNISDCRFEGLSLIPLLEIDLKIHQDGLWVNIENLLEDFDKTYGLLCQTNKKFSRYMLVRHRYKWPEELLHKFALRVSQIGVKTVKPKDLQDDFESYGLKNFQLGSHLQKYKQKIKEQYKLTNLKELENWMCPSEFQQYTDVKKECDKWRPSSADTDTVDAVSNDTNVVAQPELDCYIYEMMNFTNDFLLNDV